MSRISDKIDELESLVDELRNMRLAKKAHKCAPIVRLPPIENEDVSEFAPKTNSQTSLESVIMWAYASSFEVTSFSEQVDEHSVMEFFVKVSSFLSHLSNYRSFSFEYCWRHVLNTISQVCPTQQILLKEFVEMLSPSIEDAEKSFLALQKCSKEQRDCLKIFHNELVIQSSTFVTAMTHILDKQDYLLEVLLARIQNAITV